MDYETRLFLAIFFELILFWVCFVLMYCVKRMGNFQNLIKNKGRFYGGIFYLFGGISIIIFLFYIKRIIYATSIDNFSNFPRFFWVLGWSFIAFAFRAVKASTELPVSKIPAWKCYPTSYLITLIIISSLVFAILHISVKTSSYLFYFFSWPICIILSYNIDHIKHLLFEQPFEILKMINKK